MFLQFRENSRLSLNLTTIAMARQTLWIQLCLLVTVFSPEIRTVSSNLLRCPDYNYVVDHETLNWENRELCKSLDLQTSLLSGRYPHRVWEGRGQIRFLSGRNAELACDFQQPNNIISNVIWHKVTRPRSTNFNLYEKRELYDGLFNNGILQQPFNYPKIYAVNRPAGSSLFIQDVGPRDFGVYRCFATRYAILFGYKYPQVITVYQDIEFYPRHLQYEVLEK